MFSIGKDDSTVSPSPESTTKKEQAKLNHENYLLWKNLVLPVIRGNRLEGFITRTQKCPPKYVPATVSGEVSDEVQEYPKHEEWVIHDQILLGWLYNSIEPNVVSEVMCSETSKDLWDSIKDLFGIKTKSNIAYYKKEFQELKKGGMKMFDYLKMAKRLTDNLALASRPVPLEDLAKLLSFEKRLEQMNDGIASINLGQATANFAGTKNIGGQSAQNRGQGKFQGNQYRIQVLRKNQGMKKLQMLNQLKDKEIIW
ncbi:hypothetical protein LWI28_025163 [Acer negundo]|uniref:Gag protein n=1 Tax=Acer negundo TaxID=4023 RepID=A0AAD5P5X1_ACENE|nr:hypothetical protein LWI28_025163 [Acer negundo]